VLSLTDLWTTLLPKAMPRYQHLVPSPAGVGLAWTFHWYYGLLFFIGALLSWLLQRKKPAWAEEFAFPVASGWIAGESLMGVSLVLHSRAPPKEERHVRDETRDNTT
jgi:uncharacterized oligopeptide transporter (OPT) family protein